MNIMDGATADRPAWWERNERLRDRMGLPGYEPPKFKDGVYTHGITDELEERYGCTIQFRGKNVRHKDDWTVLVDREPLMTIGRQRNDSGNTIYQMNSEEFRQKVERWLL